MQDFFVSPMKERQERREGNRSRGKGKEEGKEERTLDTNLGFLSFPILGSGTPASPTREIASSSLVDTKSTFHPNSCSDVDTCIERRSSISENTNVIKSHDDDDLQVGRKTTVSCREEGESKELEN